MITSVSTILNYTLKLLQPSKDKTLYSNQILKTPQC